MQDARAISSEEVVAKGSHDISRQAKATHRKETGVGQSFGCTKGVKTGLRSTPHAGVVVSQK